MRDPFVPFKELPYCDLQAFVSFLFGWPPQTLEQWIHSSVLSTMNIGVQCRQAVIAAARLVHGDAVYRAGFMAIDQTTTNDERSEVTRASLWRIEKICL